MVIRDQQMEALNRSAQARFVRQLAEYLRANHGSTVVRLAHGEPAVNAIQSDQLESLVQAGVDRAGSYGFSWRSSVAAFVVTMFVVAPNFHEDQFVNELLSDRDIEPDYRMDTALERVTEEQWDQIRQTYNRKAWEL